jgi:uncharacterized membrane protein
MEAIIYSLIVAMFWGLSPIIHRYVLKQGITNQLILLISASVYFISVLCYVALSGQTSNIFVNIERKHIIMIALMTFFGLFITNIIYLKALKKTKNTHLVVVIMAMYPIVTLLLGLFILNEKLTTWGYIGFILVMMGIGIMIMSGEK